MMIKDKKKKECPCFKLLTFYLSKYILGYETLGVYSYQMFAIRDKKKLSGKLFCFQLEKKNKNLKGHFSNHYYL